MRQFGRLVALLATLILTPPAVTAGISRKRLQHLRDDSLYHQAPAKLVRGQGGRKKERKLLPGKSGGTCVKACRGTNVMES